MKPKRHPNPLAMPLPGPHLQDLLSDYIDQSVPVLKIRRDRADWYPGSAFEGVAINARRQIWRAHFLKGESGSEWFNIFLDAIGIWWTVDYVAWAQGCAFVSAGRNRFYWPHGTSGLGHLVLRPLYINWLLKLTLTAEFGPDTLHGIAGDAILLKEYDEYLENYAAFLEHYKVGGGGT
ncbi:hypothetical protein [Pseudomonas baetica]|uniref:hypothetical protein n=1 Tax=Pseudomonas baetica TaxID=674054 RepID=UPI002406C404|nr:hypothetical protein [Pseudomonas baetica]MDF9778966.1 hypothetical protein [Pseudomonas baetica]